MFGFLVVDDGVIADFGFVVDRVLRVDVGQLVAVVNVDVAIPSVVVDGDFIMIGYTRFTKRLNINRNTIERVFKGFINNGITTSTVCKTKKFFSTFT